MGGINIKNLVSTNLRKQLRAEDSFIAKMMLESKVINLVEESMTFIDRDYTSGKMKELFEKEQGFIVGFHLPTENESFMVSIFQLNTKTGFYSKSGDILAREYSKFSFTDFENFKSEFRNQLDDDMVQSLSDRNKWCFYYIGDENLGKLGGFVKENLSDIF